MIACLKVLHLIDHFIAVLLDYVPSMVLSRPSAIGHRPSNYYNALTGKLGYLIFFSERVMKDHLSEA
ncbi:MAG: hypothetical protein DI535_14100 [Citrobacter freundii]|nr:MAG: hypothetical protein DI535_14100 [Citrobacter freundii]